jgi:predicted nucleic acid-binding protein
VKLLFVDTAGWMMLADGSDRRHLDARAVRDAWLEGGGMLVLTDYVVDETLTLLRMRLGPTAAETWWRQIEGTTRVQWEWIDPSRADKAREQFFRWKDKKLSFTDCTSFVVMRERRVKRVLTSDRYFEQAGFEVVPPLG